MEPMKPGAVVHVELSSNDLAATRKFFESVFGWKFKKEQMGEGSEYWTFQAPSGPGGGLTAPQKGTPPSTLNYLLVDSVEGTVQKIRHHGGKVLMDRTEIPRVGWMAVFEVPGGLVQAIFEPLRPS